MTRNEPTQFIPLTEVPDVLPMRRRGKKLHVSTIWRWARKGAGHRKLQTWQIGGTTCTTQAAIEEFIHGSKQTSPKVVDMRTTQAEKGGW